MASFPNSEAIKWFRYARGDKNVKFLKSYVAFVSGETFFTRFGDELGDNWGGPSKGFTIMDCVRSDFRVFQLR